MSGDLSGVPPLGKKRKASLAGECQSPHIAGHVGRTGDLN